MKHLDTHRLLLELAVTDSDRMREGGIYEGVRRRQLVDNLSFSAGDRVDLGQGKDEDVWLVSTAGCDDLLVGAEVELNVRALKETSHSHLLACERVATNYVSFFAPQAESAGAW